MTELPEQSYSRLTEHLDEVPFNILFALAVIERSVSGRVYVDNIAFPRSFYILHRYGMSFLGGDSTNVEFNLAFREYAINTSRRRAEHEWMQVYPNNWNTVLTNLFGEKLIKSSDNVDNVTRNVVELNTRVNFAFNKERYLRNRDVAHTLDPKIKIIQTTAEIYTQMNGSVVPKAFWNTSKEFFKKGVGFSLYYEGKLACTSFSSFVAPGKLELGIETLPEFRGLGLAEQVCAELIDHCLKKDLEPIWACRLENTGSFKLAQKLSFVPVIELPYYRLSD